MAKKLVEETVVADSVCPDCFGSGLKDSNTLCATCAGSGAV